MKIARGWLIVALIALSAIAPVAGTAQSLDEGGEVLTAESMTGEELERWWGALGATLCGAESWLIRTSPTLGMNPYALAAGGAGCLLALLDIATT